MSSGVVEKMTAAEKISALAAELRTKRQEYVISSFHKLPFFQMTFFTIDKNVLWNSSCSLFLYAHLMLTMFKS
jgi:hypothetical protein